MGNYINSKKNVINKSNIKSNFTITGEEYDIGIDTWGDNAPDLKDRYHFLYLINDNGNIKSIGKSSEITTLDQIPIKYITDSIGGSNLNEISHWVEIEVFDHNGVNVAKNRPVTYTGELENKYNDITRVTDGNKESAQYVGVSGNDKRSMTIELSEPTLLSKIVVYHYYADGRMYLDPNVTVSPDGATWYTVYDGDGYSESSSGKSHILNGIEVEYKIETRLVDICTVEELTVDTFINHGMSKDIISNHMNDYRYTLDSNAPKILYHTLEPTEIIYEETGTPHGEIIEMIDKVNLSPSYINHVRSINITANVGNDDVLKFIISNDDGKSWLSFYEDQWVEVLKNNAVIIEKGMTLDVINNLSESQIQEITEYVDGLKLAWYMKKGNINSTFSVSHINMEYSTSL